MTEHQREQRATIIREQPLLGFGVVYAIAFFGCTLAFDVLSAWDVTGVSGVDRYLFAASLAFVYWLGLRSWARRILSGTQDSPAR
jgi:hypothetical protein